MPRKQVIIDTDIGIGEEERAGGGGGPPNAQEGGGGLGPDARFESSTQASLRTGLYGRGDTAHRPVTTGGYRTTDGGLLREQVSSAFRLLDAGQLTSSAFYARLQDLGVPVPRGLSKLVDCA